MNSSFFPLGLLLLLLQIFPPALAQTNKIFQWQFGSNFLSQSLPACATFPIVVKSFNASVSTLGSVPPYYMLAYAVGGTPKRSFLGDDVDSLSYTVDHPVGTTLMLSVVDGKGSAGGIPTRLYTVAGGQTSNCIDPKLTGNFTDFTVSANVSDTVTTCQPWGLRIKGGLPPYTLTLNAVGSPITTNVTMGPEDDVFTYINRADPNGQLIAAISDLNGRYATGTPIVKTKGSTDVDCPAQNSISQTSAALAKAEAARQSAALAESKKKQAAVIAGVTVPLLLLLFGGAFAFWYFIWRKRIPLREVEKQDFSFKPFDAAASDNSSRENADTGGQVLSINAFIAPPTTSSIEPPPRLGLASRPSIASTNVSPINSRPGFASFPRQSTRRSAKAIEAGYPEEHPEGATPGSGQKSPTREVVFQHRDGGVVKELPPPYADRLRQLEDS